MELSPDALAAIDRLVRHLPAQNDLTLIVLKGHLLVEQQMRDIVRTRAAPSEVAKTDRWSFSARTRLTRAYVAVESNELTADVWEVVDVLNALRNELAHRLESPNVPALAARLVDLQGVADLGDLFPHDTMEERVRTAIAMLVGRLTRFQAG
jgi:hypothetical protein